jgi:hypothetical protein
MPMGLIMGGPQTRTSQHDLMCRLLRLQDGSRQFFHTYGFVARDASEDHKNSASTEVAEAATAEAAGGRRQQPAAASSTKPCYSLD